MVDRGPLIDLSFLVVSNPRNVWPKNLRQGITAPGPAVPPVPGRGRARAGAGSGSGACARALSLPGRVRAGAILTWARVVPQRVPQQGREKPAIMRPRMGLCVRWGALERAHKGAQRVRRAGMATAPIVRAFGCDGVICRFRHRAHRPHPCKSHRPHTARDTVGHTARWREV